MFSSIKTSKQNREVVTTLTNKLQLGAENTIARIAFAFSLSNGEKLSLLEIRDSGGKEYSRRVLFGENESIYLGLLCQHYEISKHHPELAKYVKLHLDDGLERLLKRYHEDQPDGLELVLGLVQ